MAEEFPLTKLETISESPPIHVGKNTTVFKCPYSQQYIPRDYAAISIGQENEEICFDPKYFEEFLEQITRDLSDEQISPNIHYIIESDSSCVCCSNSGKGVFIESEFYISCDIEDRRTELSITEEHSSHKEEKLLFLCYECVEDIRSYFPSDIVNSVIASQTV